MYAYIVAPFNPALRSSTAYKNFSLGVTGLLDDLLKKEAEAGEPSPRGADAPPMLDAAVGEDLVSNT